MIWLGHLCACTRACFRDAFEGATACYKDTFLGGSLGLRRMVWAVMCSAWETWTQRMPCASMRRRRQKRPKRNSRNETYEEFRRRIERTVVWHGDVRGFDYVAPEHQ